MATELNLALNSVFVLSHEIIENSYMERKTIDFATQYFR